jgi:cytochrome c553
MNNRRLVLLVAVAAAAGVVWAGLSKLGGLSTRAQPSVVERVLTRTARRLAVPRQFRETPNPVPFSPEVWADARAHFADHCASCHGNDGSGQTEIGQSLYPKAPDMRLADTQALSDGELYWVIENGIRLTGMPAWGSGDGHDTDTWKLVHFIRRLKDLRPDDLTEMSALNPRTPAELREEQDDAQFLAGKDVEPMAPDHAHHHRE